MRTDILEVSMPQYVLIGIISYIACMHCHICTSVCICVCMYAKSCINITINIHFVAFILQLRSFDDRLASSSRTRFSGRQHVATTFLCCLTCCYYICVSQRTAA